MDGISGGAEIVENANEAFETTIHGHYFADPKGCGHEMG